MAYTPPKPHLTHPRTADDNIVRRTTLGATADLAKRLEPLNTANRTRVLLLLHADIAQLLEALETTTEP
jgi:hypothetical protein